MASLDVDAAFTKDLKDLQTVYDYNVKDSQGNSDKWRYELWLFSQLRSQPRSHPPESEDRLHQDRVAHKIHGGPMAGRSNFQTCGFQCIRPGCGNVIGLQECKETGTIVSLVYDMPQKKITTLLAFSKCMHFNLPLKITNARPDAWKATVKTRKNRMATSAIQQTSLAGGILPGSESKLTDTCSRNRLLSWKCSEGKEAHRAGMADFVSLADRPIEQFMPTPA